MGKSWLQYTHCQISQEIQKYNQRINFGQLIEYSKRNIFITKSCTKCVAETSTRPVSKKSELSLSMDEKPEILYILLLLYI